MQNAATLNLAVVDDGIVEVNETVVLSGLTLISTHPGITLNPIVPIVAITDNDNAVLSLSAPTVIIEGNTGTKILSFSVALDKATTSGFSINYNTADGTATTADNDYVSASGTLNFVGIAGETQTVNVIVNGDSVIEANETLVFNLNGLSNNFGNRLSLPATTSGGTITNDDAASITITKFDGVEGSFDGSFVLSYPNGVTSNVATTIDYSLTGTAAGAGVDYSAVIAGTATIPAGETSVTIPIPVLDDSIVEGTEIVTLTTTTVNSPYGFTVANSPVSLTITDNDQASLSKQPDIYCRE
jgi:hypothetical protein